MDDSGWIQTFTGKKFFPLHPTVKDIDIKDIAHALAYKCRFAGHCIPYYSVAQHSVIGSSFIDKEYALWFLLHDAAEAYLFDCPRPIKQYLPIIKDLEDAIMKCVAERFELSWPEPEEVKVVDNRMLETERLQIMRQCELQWYFCGIPYKTNLQSWLPEQAEGQFMWRFGDLTK